MTQRMTAAAFRLTAKRTWRDIEGPIHRDILARVKELLPDAVVHHSPNEVDLKGANVARAISKQRWNGTRKGWPDLEILYQGQFWTLEVKAPKKHPTTEQTECGLDIVRAGGRWAVVRSVKEAEDIIEKWRSR